MSDGPERSQHTEQVLRAVGYSWPELERLRDCEAI